MESHAVIRARAGQQLGLAGSADLSWGWASGLWLLRWWDMVATQTHPGPAAVVWAWGGQLWAETADPLASEAAMLAVPKQGGRAWTRACLCPQAVVVEGGGAWLWPSA